MALKSAISYKHKLDSLGSNEHLTREEEEEWAIAMFNEYKDPNNDMYVSDKPMSYQDCVDEVNDAIEWNIALHFMCSED